MLSFGAGMGSSDRRRGRTAVTKHLLLRGRVLAVLLPLVFLLVELPLGLLLRLTGQSGSLVAIVRAQAPAPPDPAGASHDPG